MQEKQVAEWLKDHPDFFVERAELLTTLALPNESEGAASLADYQLTQLREDNAALRSELNGLVEVARGNEALMDKVHGLSLRLLAVPDASAFLDEIFASLRDAFQADEVALVIFSKPLEIAGHDRIVTANPDAKKMEPFERILEAGDPFCGRLGAARLKVLFGKKAGQIESAALLPLARLGMLGIGAHDQHKFHPDMGTAFLRVLSDLLTVGLTRHVPELEQRVRDAAQRRAS